LIRYEHYTYSLAVKGKVTLQVMLQKFWISSSLPGSIKIIYL
jgi:hypothetical protein